MRLILFLLTIVPSIAFAESPAVVVYGAAWCGPCTAVKSFLNANRVAFTYLDIDTEEGRKQYEAVRGSYRGIPLTVIAGQQIRGANLVSIAAALQRANVGQVKEPARTGDQSYGGHPPSWWQAQFRQLRAQLARIDETIARYEKVAFDHHEKELLAKMKSDREIVSQSIDQLEIDASNVSLPRNYRQ